MTIAAPFPLAELSATENSQTRFGAIFELAPVPAARCDSTGVLLEMNPAFRRSLTPDLASRHPLHLSEIVSPQEREKSKALLRNLLDSHCRLDVERAALASVSGMRLSLWRESSDEAGFGHLLVIGEASVEPPAAEVELQAQRWEAVGRLTGGVAHDFNNLLTGVMLYCDLLLSSIDTRDRRRRYADEIRNAILQASSLVSQLLVFARPQSGPVSPLLLNDVFVAMRDLLTRLIGENINLEMYLDPELGMVEIDQAQAQQILLNLVLNARDALPDGGRIAVETSNCNFRPLAASVSRIAPPAFPCVLLVVGDNGFGMDAETRKQLFEPFFTTKNNGRGTGLGLTTVRSIVTTNRGLIHFESEPGRGTRAMILLPCATQTATRGLPDTAIASSPIQAQEQFQKLTKESLL